MEIVEKTEGSPIWIYVTEFLQCLTEDEPIVWYLIVSFSGVYYKICPNELTTHTNKIEKLSDVDIADLAIKESDGNIFTKNTHTIIPIEILGNSIFYVIIKKIKIMTDLNAFKYILESFVIKESRDLNQYPSFLPFILSLDDPEIDRINNKIPKLGDYFFLNGHYGTGKHTFIKNHLMYCYGVNPNKFSILKYPEIGGIQKFTINQLEVFIIDELAFCTEVDQKEIQMVINDKKPGVVLFICSAYDPIILSSRGVIQQELAELCIKERIIFPSIQKRSGSLFMTLSSYLLFKGLSVPVFFTENWLNKQIFHNGFTEIFTLLQDYFAPQSSLLSTLDQGRSIREIVKDIEVLAIDFAVKVVGKSQNKIAKYLGISRGSLQHKLKKYDYLNKEWEE
ncbi:MAG: hypothetical protein OEV78_10490 [Spirochaetia bacterium]|nr:hypothetical protein [Spirochaetia bacterium]